jgi:hypothetical protein
MAGLSSKIRHLSVRRIHKTPIAPTGAATDRTMMKPLAKVSMAMA